MLFSILTKLIVELLHFIRLFHEFSKVKQMTEYEKIWTQLIKVPVSQGEL